MARRVRAIWAGLLAGTAFLATTALASGRAYADVPVDEVHYTYLGATSISLDWRGSAQDVRYGTTSSYGSTATGNAPQWTPWSSSGPFEQATITGLAPGTTYHYSIGGGPDYTFSTPPTTSFRFDAIGDVGDTTHFGHLADTLSAIASDQPSFVLMVGDLTYANATNATQAVVDQHFDDVMAWSTSAAYMPAWGNHEWESPSIDNLLNYKGRLEMPNAQASPGSPDISCCGDDWGWFDAGGVRFISYPEPYTSDSWADWQTHADALMAAAQADPSVHFVVTFGHRPAYSTGYHPGSATLAAILDGLGATYNKYVLNINGHSHDYERFQPISGVTHVTVGSPSSLEGPWSSTDSRTAARAMHLGHLRVDVNSTGMRLQEICDDATSSDDTVCLPGTVLDEYTIGVPPPAAPVTAYYVDNTSPTCSDSGAGTEAQPFCTITKASSRLLPGQTIYVGNGTYNETVTVPSGTANSPVTVTAKTDAHPVVGAGQVHGIYLASRSYVTVSGLTITGTSSDGVYLTTCGNVVLDNLHVSYSGQPTPTGYAKGVKLVATTNSTVSNSTVDHNTDSGIYLAQGSTNDLITHNTTFANARGYTRAAPGIDLRSGGNTITDNIAHDNEDSGIQLYTGSDASLVIGNVSYANGDHGIDDFQATAERIVGNTIYRNATAGINLEGGATGGLVENNISVDNGLGSSRTVGNVRVDATSQSGTTVDYNVVMLHAPGAYYVWGTTNYASLAAFRAGAAQEAHGIQADPRWAAPDSGNFLLTAGSPAIDSANSAATGEQAVDLAGTARYDDPATVNTGAGPRGYDDRGAYEAPAGTTDASPNAALSVTPTSGTAPLTVVADASASRDLDATPIATYAFNFGDGAPTSTQSSPTTSHLYTAAGTYVLSVSVTDTAGLTSTTWTQITVGAAGNLISNSNFETNLNGWAPVEACTLSRVASGRGDGWAADLLNQNAPSAAQTCTLNDSPNWVTKSVAGTYTATTWVRADTAGGQFKLRIREYVGSTLVGTATTTLTPTGDWQQLVLSYPVVSPGSSIDLNVYETGMAAASNLFVDDVTLSSG